MFSYPWQNMGAAEQITREASPEEGTETGDRAALAQEEAVRHPLNTWVRKSGRSRSRAGLRARGGRRGGRVELALRRML